LISRDIITLLEKK